jgi:hypothetical protein
LAATAPDGTHLSASISCGSLIISVAGSAYTIAEYGEQLSWLAAALHCPHGNFVNHFTVGISRITAPGGRSSGPTGRQKSDPVCGFHIQVIETDSSSPDDDILRDALEHCSDGVVLVHGFPTARRPNSWSGVEIPLDILLHSASLDPTGFANGHHFLEGRNTTLKLAREKDGIFFWIQVPSEWHTDCLMSDHDGSRHSWDRVKCGRHILGPCDDSNADGQREYSPFPSYNKLRLTCNLTK